MTIRHEVATWVNGEPRLSYKSGLNWKTWGRRRAYDLALHLIGEYEDQGVPDYEIGIFSLSGSDLLWYFNAHQAREAIARGERVSVRPVDSVHRMGVDDFDDAKQALTEGKYVVFDFDAVDDA